MNQEKMAVLNECGIDYAEGLNRFMNNEALFEKFLLKFPDDTSYQELTAALARGDCQAGFSGGPYPQGCGGQSLHEAAVRKGRRTDGTAPRRKPGGRTADDGGDCPSVR